MKAFYRKAIEFCLSLAILFLTIGPAAAANVTSAIEIRGPVYDGSSISEILSNTAYGDGTVITIDATQFADFYYVIDQTVTNDTIKTGIFRFNGTDIGESTGEGSCNMTTGKIEFYGTSTTKGDFAGIYNITANKGSITYTDLLISNDFTAAYDAITNNLTISMIEYIVI